MFSKLNRIIKKAVNKTVKEFEGTTPRIYQHFFYGSVDISPENLVVWYLFETDEELKLAESSGLCGKLTETTVNNLTSLGYPSDAFDSFCKMNMGKKLVNIQGGAEDMKKSIVETLDNHKAMISFATQEDIDREAGGDYHLYFQ